MSIFTIIIIGVALSMDVLAISVTSGVTIKDVKLNHVLKIAFFFGLFQSGMFLLGDLLGFSMRDLISNIDHWVSFLLLSFIGGKMIYESFQIGAEEKKDPLNTFVLLILAIATSVDAFAVGLSFALLKVPVLLPAIIIGVVTFVISSIGVLIGEKIGHIFENKIEIIGGLILIAIGVKILVEHQPF